MTLQEQINAHRAANSGSQEVVTQPPEAQSLKGRIDAHRTASAGAPTADTGSSISGDEPDEFTGWDAFKKGLGYSAAKTGLGIMDLLGVGDEYDREAMELWKGDVDKSGGMGFTGQAVGEIAQLAMPASIVGKAAKGSKLLKSLGKAAPFVGEGALGAVHGAVQLPDGDDSRLVNAAQGAGLGIAGAGAGKVLGKTLEGFKKTKSAKELLEGGVKLSAGQQSTGMPQAVEELLSYLPLSARRVNKLREAGSKDWSNYAINQVNTPTPNRIRKGDPDWIEGVGTEAMNELKQQINTGYNDAWSLANKRLGKAERDYLVDAIDTELPLLTADEKTVLTRVRKSIDDTFAEGSEQSTDEAAKIIDRAIGKQLKASKANPNLTTALDSVRAKLRNTTSKEAKAALSAMDKKYTKFLTIQDAADKAGLEESAGNFTAQMLKSSSGKFAPKGATGRGTSPLYKVMRQGRETVDKNKIGGVLDRFRRVMQQVEVPVIGGVTESVLNSTVGNTALQKALRTKAGTRLREDAIRGIQAHNQ